MYRPYARRGFLIHILDFIELVSVRREIEWCIVNSDIFFLNFNTPTINFVESAITKHAELWDSERL